MAKSSGADNPTLLLEYIVFSSASCGAVSCLLGGVLGLGIGVMIGGLLGYVKFRWFPDGFYV